MSQNSLELSLSLYNSQPAGGQPDILASVWAAVMSAIFGLSGSIKSVLAGKF